MRFSTNILIGSMTGEVRTTTATVHRVVYRTDHHASVILFITASMYDFYEDKRREQNLFVRSGKSEAEQKFALDVLYY